MGVVTSRQRYVNPLMDCDEVRLANPQKTKSTVSQTGQVISNNRGEFHQVLGEHVKVHLWDIDDGKLPGFYTTAG